MIKQLKNILNSYKDLEDIELWVNSENKVESIIVDEYNINLITTAEIKIDGKIDKEGNHTNNKRKVNKAIEYLENTNNHNFSKSELLCILKSK